MRGLLVILSALIILGGRAMPVCGTFAGGISFSGGEIGVHARLPGWASAQFGCDWEKVGNGARTFSINHGGVCCFECESDWQCQSDGTLFGKVVLSCVADCELQCLALAAEFAVAPVVGRTWRADEFERVLPETINDPSGFGYGVASRFEFPLPDGRNVVLKFPRPVRYHAQDSRQWGSSWSVRFGDRAKMCKYTKGERIVWEVSVSSDDGIRFGQAKPYVVQEGDAWVRMTSGLEVRPGSALDFSGMRLQDAPAGKYGWLRNVGGNFEFERKPGVAQCFYGVNLSHTANYPAFDKADRLIDRFVRIGYNSIRIHHHDRFWGDVANRERLDYLVSRAISHGLYVTTDLYVSRTVKWRDVGIDRDGDMDRAEYKRLIATDELVFRDWCGFAREFLEHVNPYTGRAYKDEPAMPLISLVNEGGENLETWRRCSSFVRSLGAKALLTNDNDGRRHADGEGIVSHYDYVDTHSYVDHPVFIANYWSLPSMCDNGNPVLSGRPEIFLKAWSRGSAKPHVASEWNFSWPGRYRSQAGLIVGFKAASLDWDGLWRFAYAHSDRDLDDHEGCSPDYFNIANDPVMQATDRAGVCLYLRGDARTAGESEYVPDVRTGTLKVVTPLTCGGFSEGGDIDAGVLKARVTGAPATVWASSIDGRKLAESSRILLVHLTDVQPDGARYADDTRKILCKFGRGHLLQVGEAQVALAVTEPSAYRAFGLDVTGRRTGEIPVRVRNRHLVLTVSTRGPAGGRIYYELVRNAVDAGRRPALVLRFDDNKPSVQWREVAGIFEKADGRCSFAVNAATLDEDQWRTLRELSDRGHEIMDHTAQHAVFKLLLPTAADADRYRAADFFDHVEGDGRLIMCRPNVDLAHPENVRVTATMKDGIMHSDDPAFVENQHFSQKFYIPSKDALYGFGRDCGGGLFKKGREQKCSDFWGRWTTNSFASCEIILLADDAVQPSKDLMRAQARNSVSRFVAHGIPAPKTWIRPGGWENEVDWRLMKAVYGDEFGYEVADSTGGAHQCKDSRWCYRSDFAFFDSVPDVEKVYQKAINALAGGRSFAYISHQWTNDRARYLGLCRGLAEKLKDNGVPLVTYSHIAD